MSTMERVRRATLGAERWEACVTSDGRTIGEAEWLRRRTDEGCISGAVTIELTESGETVELRQGDLASFPKGTPSVWTVVEPLEKFTVVSG